MPGEQKSREAAGEAAHEFGRERPVVVILVGAPGQGKSSVAAKIKAAAGAVDVVILCQDDVPRNIKRNRRQYLERQLRDGLAARRERLANGSPGLPVLFVVDRVHWNEEQRAHFLKECEVAELDDRQVMAVHVNGASTNECIRRVLARKGHKSLNPRYGQQKCIDVVRLYTVGKNKVTPPSLEEGFGQVITIDVMEKARVDRLVAFLTKGEAGDAVHGGNGNDEDHDGGHGGGHEGGHDGNEPVDPVVGSPGGPGFVPGKEYVVPDRVILELRGLQPANAQGVDDDIAAEFVDAAACGDVGELIRLLRRGVHCDTRREADGKTAWNVACDNGHDDVLAVLIRVSKGEVDRFRRNQHGKYAAHGREKLREQARRRQPP